MSKRSPVPLIRVETGVAAEAVLIEDLSPPELATIDDAWQSYLQPIIENKSGRTRQHYHSWYDFLASAYDAILSFGEFVEYLPENTHWEWYAKQAFGASKAFGIECDGDIQGLMLVRTNEVGRLGRQYTEPLVYVDNLASAYWNLRDLTPKPRFRGIGYILMAAAMQFSIEQGWEGRVGLHALPKAENFYHKCGMTNLGIDASHEHLRYFEMTAVQARDFLERVSG